MLIQFTRPKLLMFDRKTKLIKIWGGGVYILMPTSQKFELLIIRNKTSCLDDFELTRFDFKLITITILFDRNL